MNTAADSEKSAGLRGESKNELTPELTLNLTRGESEHHRRLVHLAGLPASGKSYFGQWAEKRFGVLHLDVEKGPLPLGLDAFWHKCFEEADVTSFVESLRSLNRSVLINWGFPVSCLPIVNLLKSAGVTLWWFDADPDQARREFVKRADVALAAFERQIADISREWRSIQTTFEPNIITTLAANGQRVAPAELFDHLFAPNS